MVLMQNDVQNRQQIFNEEFLPHADALYNFAYNFVRSEDDANDLVQETFIKAFDKAASYAVGSNARAWLFTILKNTFINDYRKRERRPRQVELEDHSSFHGDSDSTDLSGFTDLRTEIFADLLGDEATRAFEALSEDSREVILLSVLEDFKYEEVAEIMDLPIGTVRSKLFRAKNALKAQLADYAADSFGIRDVRGAKNK